MKRWLGPAISISLVILFIFLSAPLRHSQTAPAGNEGTKLTPAVFGKSDEVDKRKEEDSNYIQILKAVREKLDEWLKSLNEEIEREDVTRFKVRFLEILRSILEWLREKVNAKIEPWEKGPKKTETGGSIRETRDHLARLRSMG